MICYSSRINRDINFNLTETKVEYGVSLSLFLYKLVFLYIAGAFKWLQGNGQGA